MKINKSTRHAKITGDFGETVVLYWLSKYGFECAPVDHTGIDIIARNPHTNEIMGISVKSRSRIETSEQASITIPKDNFGKVEAACKAFGCVPYFAVVVDAGDTIRGFIVPMKRLLEVSPKRKTGAFWKVSRRYLNQYAEDPNIMAFEFKTKTTKWWPDNKGVHHQERMEPGRDFLAKSVRFSEDSMILQLDDGRALSVPLAWYPRLANGTPAERENYELIGDGEGIHWPRLDEDISVEGLLAGRRSAESAASLARWMERRKEAPNNSPERTG